MCITLLFLLPSDQLDLNSKQSLTGGVLPFEDTNEKIPLGSVIRNNYSNEGPVAAAAVNDNKNVFPYADTDKNAQNEQEVCMFVSIY